MNLPEKLSDFDNPDFGTKSDDVVNLRKFKSKVIRKSAAKGNKLALMAENLDLEARKMGINSDYIEDLDSEDFGGMY